jgi:hypothetical protein
MQLGKKSKTTGMFERVRGDMGDEVEESSSSPLVPNNPLAAVEHVAAQRVSSSLDRDAIHVAITETINARLSREGSLISLDVKGDLHLRISDQSLTKVKLDLVANASHGAKFRTHPNVDRALFTNSKAIQMSNVLRGFPVNNSVGVLRWSVVPKADNMSAIPITFTVWVNKGSDNTYTITVEYELTGGDALKDVTVIIPYTTSEPAVSSFDATYEVSGDSLEWTIGLVDEDNATGSFEFEAQAEDENEFFPMQVKFGKTKPFVDVDVDSYSLLSLLLGLNANLRLGENCDTPRNERRSDLLKGDKIRCRFVSDRVSELGCERLQGSLEYGVDGWQIIVMIRCYAIEKFENAKTEQRVHHEVPTIACNVRILFEVTNHKHR